MASADALDDDWWLLEGAEGPNAGAKVPRKRASLSDTVEKKKRRKKPKIDDVKHEMEESFSLLHSVSRQRDELSQALSASLLDKLTPVEAKELKLKKAYFASCSQCDGGSLSLFCQEVFPDSAVSIGELKAKGSPLLIVLTCSALRAVQLRKELATFAGSVTVAKLFARHMKLEEQCSFLASRVTPLAVATPTRLKQLLDSDALSVERLRVVIVDWYWRDAKLRRFADIPEVWKSFVGLYHSDIHMLVKARRIKLALY